ncbi:hypothetical protein PMIN02_002353 [Paraphaeosphaeria minitans]|uniref:Something about silencing protein 4 domain-containing protein n=1 Tax=Paraphaeosphaeria minitans TaxID=565426 RepID=A0A9P6GT98_9PLEO|nr:hypothetical protein PMIN01_00688 [Paraphaeosphaeria minitans]
MTTPAANLHARKMAIPPTSPSEKQGLSSLALPARADPVSSSPTSQVQTPRERRNISNRFWDKNESRMKEGVNGVDLASDSSDPDDDHDDDDSEAARSKKHDHLHTRIKRLLTLETTGTIRLKTLESNETIREYNKLLDAFTHKPKTKRKRARYTAALQVFLEDHHQILDLYNRYAILDHDLRKDRILPEFMRDEEGSASASKDDDQVQASDVRRAPAKHALNRENDSDEEGIVSQTFKSGEDFHEPSVFNARGLTVPSIFNRKTSATAEKNERRFLLHRRDEPLATNGERERDLDGRTAGDHDLTPTRPPSKKRRLG